MTASSCYLFQSVPKERMATLAALSRSRTILAGEWLFHKDDRAENIYLVEEGAVELVMRVNQDTEIPVALIRPGNGCVGVGALVKPYVYTLSARCKEDARLSVMPSAELLRWFETDPEFGRTVLANLAQRLFERLGETRQEIKLHFMNLFQAAMF